MAPELCTTMLKQVESTLESPEALLRAMEAEIAFRRARRSTGGGQRAAILGFGLLLIVGGTAVALCALFSSLNGLPHPRVAEAPAQTVSQP